MEISTATIDRARRELQTDGAVSADTYCALTALGFEADAIIQSLHEEKN